MIKTEPPPLDVFAFPSEAHGWFRLLLVSTFVLGLNVSFVVLLLLPFPLVSEIDEQHELMSRAMVMGKSFLDHKEEAASLAKELPAELLLAWRNTHPWVVTQLALLLALVATNIVLYFWHPRRQRLRHRCEELTLEQAPTVVTELQGRARKLGLASLRIEHKPGLLGGLAFGVKGGETILLHGSPKTLEITWDHATRVIALHEMAHIANQDIQLREKAYTLWIASTIWSLLLLVILMSYSVYEGLMSLLSSDAVAAAEAFGTRLWAICTLLSFTLFLLFMIWSLQAAVIRARELYADQRVVAWGLGARLEKVITSLPTRTCPGIWPRLKKVFAYHPPRSSRLESIRDWSYLYRTPTWMPLLEGMLLSASSTFILLPVGTLLNALLLLTSWVFWSSLPFLLSLPGSIQGYLLALANLILLNGPRSILLIILMVFSWLIVGTLGHQVQKEVLYQRAVPSSGQSWKLWRSALLFSIGCEISFAFDPYGRFSTRKLSAGELLLWLACSTLFMRLWFCYVKALTSRLVATWMRKSRPKYIMVVVGALAWLAMVHILFGLYELRVLWTLDEEKNYAGWFYSEWSTAEEKSRALAQGTYLVLRALGASLAIWSAMTLCAAWLWTLAKDSRCSSCGEATSRAPAVGRLCSFCGQPLAPWAYRMDCPGSADLLQG